jgi:hypothetical protein
MQSCEQSKTEVASKEVSLVVRCDSSHGNEKVVCVGSKERSSDEVRTSDKESAVGTGWRGGGACDRNRGVR